MKSVVQSVVQDIRYQIERRPRAPAGGALRFNADGSAAESIFDEAFGALAYNGMPTKAPRLVPVAPSYSYLTFLSGSYDVDRATAAGVTTTTRSFTAVGGGAVTRIGVFSSTDALSFILTGSANWARSPGVTARTPGVAGTIAYVNGGFSTDFTVQGNWTSADAGGTTSNSSSISYTPNVQYRFDVPNGWWIEPTAGLTYTQIFVTGANGDSLELHGGATIGTETVWNGVRVQPTLHGEVYTIASQTLAVPTGGAAGVSQKGLVGGRANAKWAFLWTDRFNTSVDVHVRGIDSTFGYGVTGKLQWTW